MKLLIAQPTCASLRGQRPGGGPTSSWGRGVSDRLTERLPAHLLSHITLKNVQKNKINENTASSRTRGDLQKYCGGNHQRPRSACGVSELAATERAFIKQILFVVERRAEDRRLGSACHRYV